MRLIIMYYKGYIQCTEDGIRIISNRISNYSKFDSWWTLMLSAKKIYTHKYNYKFFYYLYNFFFPPKGTEVGDRK